MPELSYRQPGLTLQAGSNATEQQIRDFQRDLRSLGYLKARIDGQFGGGTQLAVRALQHDLLSNDGSSRSGDGAAPVKIVDYNNQRVAAVTGAADQNLVECISDMLDDANFPKLPSVDNPAEENRKVASQIAQLPSDQAPIPFLMAILKQESNLQHFHEPGPQDEDTFILVGLDRNDPQKDVVTSRGYGVGQYTLFHHPPRPDEVTGFISDVAGNVQMATKELRDKFDRFVNGPASRADDRQAEFGSGPLRLCKYDSSDPRYMRDCKQCLIDAGTQDIQSNVTPVFEGSSLVYSPTQYYSTASYSDVPIRKNIQCDWSYAVRRYNGAGSNSYHYQTLVLKHLLEL